MNAARTILLASLAVAVVLATGCQTYYRTPGAPAPIGEMTAPSIAKKLRVQPEAPIPATLAFVRVQDGNYYSSSIAGVRRGGVSIVSASDLEVPADVERLQKWTDVAACARLSAIIIPQVKDTGPGLAPGVTERLFRPFFTTKNDGNGLGLWISLGLVERYGDRITAGNRADGQQGAVFTVRLLTEPQAPEAVNTRDGRPGSDVNAPP